MPESLTLQQAADALGVPLPVMRALLVHQRIPGAYAMSEETWRIPPAAIEAYRAEHPGADRG